MTLLFSYYIRERRFQVAEFLPLRDGLKEDFRLGVHRDWSFLRGAYIQPELAANKKVLQLSGNDADHANRPEQSQVAADPWTTLKFERLLLERVPAIYR